MEVLLIGNDVGHLVVVVSFIAFKNCANVARQLDAGSILHAHNGLAQLLEVLGQIDDLGALRVLGQPLIVENACGSLHAGIFDLRLACVHVVGDVETSKGVFVSLDALLAKALPKSKLFALAVAHAPEVATCTLVDARVPQRLQLRLQGHNATLSTG